MGKNRIVIIICYLMIVTGYFAGDWYLQQNGMEYLLKIKLVTGIFLWCLPVLLIGSFLWRAYQKKQAGLWFGLFLTYVIVMALVSVCAAFIQVAQLEDEYRMKDGYLRITESAAYGTPNEVYYAEPVYGIARRKFTWDTEHYAQSLSRIYDTEFVPMMDERKGQVYISEDYPDVKVQVWGVDRTADPELKENLSYLLTSSEIEKKGQAYFGDAVQLTKKQQTTAEQMNLEDNPSYEVTALTIPAGQMDAAGAKIAAFMQEELKTGLFDHVQGSIFIILKSSVDDPEGWSFNLPFSVHPSDSWVYGADVTAEVIQNCLHTELILYQQSGSWVEEPDSSNHAYDDTVYSGGDDAEEAPEGQDQTEFYNQINDGYVAIYSGYMADADGARFQTTQDAKGNSRMLVYEDDDKVRFLVYDRVSKNEKCLLYVYHEADKASDGSYSLQEARILDMYAYVIDTGEVIDSGRQAWGDVGTSEYREATGE